MEIIYYTIAAIILYGASDYILNTIEIKMGKRLPNRSFIFLIIITILSLISFSVIRAIVATPPATQQTKNTQSKPAQQEPASAKIVPNNKEDQK